MSKVGAVNLLNLKSVTSFLKTLLQHKPSQRVNDFLSTHGKRPLVSAFLEEPLVLGQLFQTRTQVPAPSFRQREPRFFSSCAPAPETTQAVHPALLSSTPLSSYQTHARPRTLPVLEKYKATTVS